MYKKIKTLETMDDGVNGPLMVSRQSRTTPGPDHSRTRASRAPSERSLDALRDVPPKRI